MHQAGDALAEQREHRGGFPMTARATRYSRLALALTSLGVSADAFRALRLRQTWTIAPC